MDAKTIWWIIAIAVLFILVISNNKKNVNKLRNRKSRHFKDNYLEKKKENEKKDKS